MKSRKLLVSALVVSAITLAGCESVGSNEPVDEDTIHPQLLYSLQNANPHAFDISPLLNDSTIVYQAQGDTTGKE